MFKYGFCFVFQLTFLFNIIIIIIAAIITVFRVHSDIYQSSYTIS
jgi:uncharacterized membrane protein